MSRDIGYELERQKFIWDSEKADTNLFKHKISFEEAASVFVFESVIYVHDDTHSSDEERIIAIGFSNRLNILMVCHCMRENDSVIRIISARKATREERQTWEEENYEGGI
jgi:hypothetical protein